MEIHIYIKTTAMRTTIYVKTYEEAYELTGSEEIVNGQCDCGESPAIYTDDMIVVICEHCAEYYNL